MRNRVFFVRHGENPANISKEFSSNILDQSLTDKGVLQAEQTAAHFGSMNIQAIYSSPLRRAVETATLIAAPHGLETVILEAFREIDIGSLEGRPATAVDWGLHQQIVGNWLDGDAGSRFPGGEDYHELWARIQGGLEEVTAGRRDEKLIVVGHGGNLTYTLKDLCPGIDVEWLRKTRWDNCAITEVELDRVDGRLEGRLIIWNYHDHLHGEAAELIPGVPDIE